MSAAYHRPPRETIGIDLATQAKRTAVCRVTWTTELPQVEILDGPWTDTELRDLIIDSEKVGIDCPLGWPVGLVQAITAHENDKVWPGRGLDPKEHRITLKYRLTDLAIKDRPIARWPLSVSTDRIGVVALRCALLLDLLAERGHRVDRTGAGVVAEPASTGQARASSRRCTPQLR